MNKFNRSYVENQTEVKLFGLDDNEYYLVKEIHPTRQWIKVHGAMGSFQTGNVRCFTNKLVKNIRREW